MVTPTRNFRIYRAYRNGSYRVERLELRGADGGCDMQELRYIALRGFHYVSVSRSIYRDDCFQCDSIEEARDKWRELKAGLTEQGYLKVKGEMARSPIVTCKNN